MPPAPFADDSARMQNFERRIAALYERLGMRQVQGAVPVGTSTVPPKVASFLVVGQDGRYIIDIINAADAAGSPGSSAIGIIKSVVQLRRKTLPAIRTIDISPSPSLGQAHGVYHQLQSSTNTLFDATGGVTEYGPETKTHWVIEDPNQTKYWRVRSKYLNSAYNDWTYFEDPNVCGVRAIWAGLLRTSSMVENGNFNQTNFATVNSIDNGVNATIRVYGASGGVGTAWSGQRGATLTSYPAASLAGYAYSTPYWVVYDVAAGIYRVFTTSPPILPDRYVYAGNTTTVGAGGGGGVSGGGGAGGSDGSTTGRPLPR